MKWIKYEMHTTTRDEDALGEILIECGIGGYEITDHVPLSKEEEQAMYTDIPKDRGVDDGTAILTFYTEAPENEESAFFSTGSSLRDETLMEEQTAPLTPEEWLQRFFKAFEEHQRLFPVERPDITYQIEDDSAWKDTWKENFKPFRIAEDMIIKPSWEEVPEGTGKEDIVVEIDPGSAFGSGTHETTKLCLLSLRSYLTPETRMMDAGCGSGILAIASILCGADFVLGLDIDPAAVSGTLENAERNHIGTEKLQAVHANILEDAEHLKAEFGQSFQMIVANILADVIIPLTPIVREFLVPGGFFISSGILCDRSGEVEQALRKNGFTILEKNTMGEWCSFAAKYDRFHGTAEPGMLHARG